MALQNLIEVNLPEIFNNGTFEEIYFKIVDLNEDPIDLSGSFISCKFNYKTTNGTFVKTISTVLGITILDEINGKVKIDSFETINIESGGYDFNLEIRINNINGISIKGNCCEKFLNLIYKINIQEKVLNIDNNNYPNDNFIKLLFYKVIPESTTFYYGQFPAQWNADTTLGNIKRITKNSLGQIINVKQALNVTWAERFTANYN